MVCRRIGLGGRLTETCDRKWLGAKTPCLPPGRHSGVVVRFRRGLLLSLLSIMAFRQSRGPKT